MTHQRKYFRSSRTERSGGAGSTAGDQLFLHVVNNSGDSVKVPKHVVNNSGAIIPVNNTVTNNAGASVTVS